MQRVPAYRLPLLLIAAAAAMLLCASSATAAMWIDPPTFTPVSGEDAQHVDADGKLWIRSGSSGSALMSVEAGGDNGEPDYVSFPNLAASGWSWGGPLDDWSEPYGVVYSWTAASTSPAPFSLMAVDAGGGTNVSIGPYSVELDSQPPYGTVLAAHSVVTRDTTAPAHVVPGVDDGVGIGGWTLIQRHAPSVSGSCVGWGAWEAFGGVDPAEPVTASLPVEGCYEFGAEVHDRVGNIEHVEQGSPLVVDRSAPFGAIDAPLASTIMGGNEVVLTGTAHDAITSIRSASLMVEDRYAICSGLSFDALGRWSCTWSIGYDERTGPATLLLSMIDQAGNRAWSRVDVEIIKPRSPFGPREEDIDRTPPVAALASIPSVSWRDHVRIKPSAYDDRPGYIEFRIEQQVASARAVRMGPWQPATYESESVILEERGETSCFRALAIDLMGNRAYSAPRCTTLPLDDIDLRRRGRGWIEVEHPYAWLKTMHQSTRRGATLEVRVADTRPQLIVARCRTCGPVTVYHGKRKLRTYSTYSRRALYRRTITLPTLKSPRSAPLRIVAASKRKILVDAVVARR